MKAWMIAQKTLREAWREPQFSLLILLFPALMILVYYIGFGQSGKGMANYLTILVDNQDRGENGATLVNGLRQAEFDDKPIFTVRAVTSRQEAEILLRERKAALLLTIPADFSERMGGKLPGPARLEKTGDPYSDLYTFAGGFLDELVDAYVDQTTSWKEPSHSYLEFVSGTGTLNDFQFGVPGVMVFGVLFGIISSAMIMVREQVNGTLLRLRLAGVGGGDLVWGMVLAQIGISAVQLPLAFGTALLFGFDSPGSLLLAIAIGAMLSLSATGLGLVTACFARNDGEAANLATLFMMPMVFLSGAIFPMPPIPLFQIGGQSINAYDFMPSVHAAEAMRRVLIYGDGPDKILYALAALSVLSVLYLALGAWLYQRLRLRKLN